MSSRSAHPAERRTTRALPRLHATYTRSLVQREIAPTPLTNQQRQMFARPRSPPRGTAMIGMGRGMGPHPASSKPSWTSACVGSRRSSTSWRHPRNQPRASDWCSAYPGGVATAIARDGARCAAPRHGVCRGVTELVVCGNGGCVLTPLLYIRATPTRWDGRLINTPCHPHTARANRKRVMTTSSLASRNVGVVHVGQRRKEEGQDGLDEG